MDKLKPCPFCGGADLHLKFLNFSGWGADVIVCYDCLAIFSQQEITCEEDLIDAWNRRASDDSTRKRPHPKCDPAHRIVT